jgi:hypothetical protein
MSKLIFIFFLCLTSQQLFSSEKIPTAAYAILGSKDLPLEMNLLLKSLQSAPESGGLTQEMVKVLINIDSLARLLSKEDIFLLSKIEIYKTMLKTDSNNPKATINSDTLKIFKMFVSNADDPFVRWFFGAMAQDIQTLLSSTSYKEYLLQKNNGKIERLEYQKIDKKIQLLYRWAILIDSDEKFQKEITSAMAESLKNIEESFYLMILNTNFQKIPQPSDSISNLKFFTLQVIDKSPLEHKNEVKSVEDILSPILEENNISPDQLPKPSSENWLIDENVPNSLKNLPKPADDANWLQDF